MGGGQILAGQHSLPLPAGNLPAATAGSPAGHASISRRAGELADATIHGEPYEWEIFDVG